MSVPRGTLPPRARRALLAAVLVALSVTIAAQANWRLALLAALCALAIAATGLRYANAAGAALLAAVVVLAAAGLTAGTNDRAEPARAPTHHRHHHARSAAAPSSSLIIATTARRSHSGSAT